MKTVELGTITRPHGLRGEVKVRLHWASSEAVFDAARLLVLKEQDPQWMEVESARGAAPAILLKLRGIDDRTAADRLRGASIAVPRSELPDPEEGEYYLADLVGARVETPRARLGEVVEVRVYASIDALVIRTEQGQLVEQPLAEPWVQNIDAASGVVQLTSDEGLVR